MITISTTKIPVTDTSSETEENKFPEPLTSLFNSESINFPEDKN